MNFINRHIAASLHEGMPLEEHSPPLGKQRKWPIRYRSIELAAICADLATIVLASIIAVFLYRIYSNGTATGLANAIGSAIVVSQDRIRRWLDRSGNRPNLVIDYDASQPVGRTINRGESQSHPCSHAVVVLKYAAPSYYVLTSYPECRS